MFLKFSYNFKAYVPQYSVLRFQHILHLVQEIYLRNDDSHVEFSVIMLASHNDNPRLLKKKTPRISADQNQEHLMYWDERFKTLLSLCAWTS
jgi:hypothetical protein